MSRRRIMLLPLFLFSVFTLIHAVHADGLTIEAPTYFDEQDQQFENIHYLPDELLSFSFCTENEPLVKNATITCEDGTTKHVPLYRKHNTDDICYFSNQAMENISCDAFQLDISYQTENKKKSFERSFVKQKQSKLITHILNENTEDMDAMEISNYLVVLNDLGQVNEDLSNQLYERLKSMRNNEKKCWPEDNCDLDYTAQILRNLDFAGYETNSRLLLDGRLYLNRQLIEREDTSYEFDVKFEQDEEFFEQNDDVSEITCTVTPDEDSEEAENTSFDDDSEREGGYFSNELLVNCDNAVDTITLTVYNEKEEPFIKETYEESNGFTYTLPSISCLGQGDCNLSSTLHALSTYGDDELENKGELESFLETGTLYDYNDDIYYTSDDPYEGAGQHLTYKENEELVDYLRFAQNNDGSWGDVEISDRENIKQTSWAVLGLEARTDNSEYVEDAKDWIYFEEPNAGWGSIDKNVMAYLAIKEKIKPFLKISPKNVLTGEVTFFISNPTTYKLRNLQLSISDSIEDAVFYPEDLGELEPGETRNFTVSIDQSFFGVKTGELELSGVGGDSQNLDLISMSVNIKGNAAFTLPEKQYQITEQDPVVNIEVNQHASSFTASCNISNPLTGQQKEMEVTQQTKTIPLKNPQFKKGSFQGEVSCTDSNGDGYTLPMHFSVELLPTEFNVNKDTIIIGDKERLSLTITSASSSEKQLTLEVTKDYNGVVTPVSSNINLSPDTEQTVSFTMKNKGFLDALGNKSSGAVVISSESGYSRSVPIKLQGENSGEGGGFPWIIVSLMGIVLVFIGLVGWRYYQLRKEDQNEGGDDGGEEEIEL